MRENPMFVHDPRLSLRTALILVGSFAALLARSSAAQEWDAPEPAAHSLPFQIGERLEYHVRLGKLGATGRGSMSVSGPVDVRGTPAYLLRFDFRARVGPLKVVDRTESWLDPLRMAALRFHKRERHPFTSATQTVELFPSEKRWEGARGATGKSPTDAPLDELSFIYFIRTLPLAADTTYRFDRHFEADRNPVSIRVIRREAVTTDAGAFQTILVEMRVRDPERYGDGEGVIRINLTDDHRRIPVRIESEMPVAGRAVFTLVRDTQEPL